MRTPLKHQAEGLAYSKGRESLALFWQMRLGKSLVAIRWASDKGKVLIVSPLTTVISWEDELRMEEKECVALVGSSSQKIALLESNWNEVDWFIINPEGLRAAPTIAKHWPWGVVIADESTFMANPKAQITKLMRKELRDVAHKCLLTGEPVPEGPQQIVEPMLWLYDEFMGARNYYQWQHRHMGRGPFGFVPTLSTQRETKKAFHAKSSVLRAKDVGMFMPKVRETRYCELPQKLRSLYDELEKEWAVGELSTIHGIVKDIWLAQLAAGVVPKDFEEDKTYVSDHKSKELIYLLKGELKGQQAVVWSRYTREIKMHKSKLIQAGFDVSTIRGSVSKHLRSVRLKNFKAGKSDVLICQQKCAQYGMDMSHCDVMIYTSNYWDWLVRAQCDERTSHPKKKTPSLIIDLVSANTIEKDVVDALQGKKINSRHFMEKIRGSRRIRKLVSGVS